MQGLKKTIGGILKLIIRLMEGKWSNLSHGVDDVIV